MKRDIDRRDVDRLDNSDLKIIYAYNENRKINSKIRKNKKEMIITMIALILTLIVWITTVVLFALEQFGYGIISAIILMPCALLAVKSKSFFKALDDAPALGVILIVVLFAPIIVLIMMIKILLLMYKNSELEDEKYKIDD